MVNLYQLFWSIDRYEAIMQTEMSMCFSIDKKTSRKEVEYCGKKNIRRRITRHLIKKNNCLYKAF